MILKNLVLILPSLGFLVGLLVGLTGVGGGVLMTPFLILGLGMPPATAVGTDMAYAAVTKVFGAWQHWRQGTVDLRLVRDLALGSVPGALAAIALLMWLGGREPALMDIALRKAIGVILAIAAGLFLAKALGKLAIPAECQNGGWDRWKVVAIGALGGLLVGLTSVGSGSVMLALLALVAPLGAEQLVGADVAHAAILLAVSALGHWGLGGVEVGTAALLLLGSIPGVILGSRLILSVPRRRLQAGLAGVLFTAAAKIF
jgi:hypothetical protein